MKLRKAYFYDPNTENIYGTVAEFHSNGSIKRSVYSSNSDVKNERLRYKTFTLLYVEFLWLTIFHRLLVFPLKMFGNMIYRGQNKSCITTTLGMIYMRAYTQYTDPVELTNNRNHDMDISDAFFGRFVPYYVRRLQKNHDDQNIQDFLQNVK